MADKKKKPGKEKKKKEYSPADTSDGPCQGPCCNPDIAHVLRDELNADGTFSSGCPKGSYTPALANYALVQLKLVYR